MIMYPPEKRLTAQESYNHEWIKSKKFNVLEPDITQNILTNLKNFHVLFGIK